MRTAGAWWDKPLAARLSRRMEGPAASGKTTVSAPAQQVGATLLHNDPEFPGVAHLPQEWLG